MISWAHTHPNPETLSPYLLTIRQLTLKTHQKIRATNRKRSKKLAKILICHSTWNFSLLIKSKTLTNFNQLRIRLTTTVPSSMWVFKALKKTKSYSRMAVTWFNWSRRRWWDRELTGLKTNHRQTTIKSKRNPKRRNWRTMRSFSSSWPNFRTSPRARPNWKCKRTSREM